MRWYFFRVQCIFHLICGWFIRRRRWLGTSAWSSCFGWWRFWLRVWRSRWSRAWGRPLGKNHLPRFSLSPADCPAALSAAPPSRRACTRSRPSPSSTSRTGRVRWLLHSAPREPPGLRRRETCGWWLCSCFTVQSYITDDWLDLIQHVICSDVIVHLRLNGQRLDWTANLFFCGILLDLRGRRNVCYE